MWSLFRAPTRPVLGSVAVCLPAERLTQCFRFSPPLQLPLLPTVEEVLLFQPTAVYRTQTPGGKREEPTVLLKAGATMALGSRSQAGSITGPQGQKLHLGQREMSQRESRQPWHVAKDALHRLVRVAEASGRVARMAQYPASEKAKFCSKAQLTQRDRERTVSQNALGSCFCSL